MNHDCLPEYLVYLKEQDQSFAMREFSHLASLDDNKTLFPSAPFSESHMVLYILLSIPRQRQCI